MGDRTTCYLRLGGILSAEHISILAASLLDADPDGYKKTKEIEKALRSGDPEFTFYEVNYGNMDETLSETLEALRLSYAWKHESGDNYGPGVTFHDARTNFAAEFPMLGDDIMLTIREAKLPHVVEAAEHWEKFHRSLQFTFAENHHEALKRVAESEYFASYAGLAIDTALLNAA